MEKKTFLCKESLFWVACVWRDFLTLSSTDFSFIFGRPSLKGSEENMVALTLNGSALSRLMMPSKL